jgi:histidinol phosphatase-like PHP family hydrolase
LGIRNNRHYPNGKFWKTVGEVGAPVTFGFDAHAVVEAGDLESLKVAEELVEKYGLNYIGKPAIIDIKKKYEEEYNA